MLNCETEGIIGTTATIIANIQVNEVLKMILNIGVDLKNSTFNNRFVKSKL